MKTGIFYGWWVLVGLFFIGTVSPMGRYSLTAIAPFISSDLGLNNTQIGTAFTIHFVVYAFAAILGGWMVDKIGGRWTLFIGGIVSLIGMTLLSRMNALWQLYLFFGFIMGLALSMTHFVPNIATARKWFIKKGGLAVGIVSAAFGIGTALLSPLITRMCGSPLGWRTTWFICAVAFGGITMLLAAWLVRDSPKSKGLYPDGSSPEEQDIYQVPDVKLTWKMSEALATFPLWMLMFAFSLVGISFQGMAAHVVIWAVDLKYPEATAGIYVTALMLPMALAGLFGGWLGDRFGKKWVMVIAYIIGTLVTFSGWLWVGSAHSLLIFTVIFGITQGLPIPLFPAYLGDVYGQASLGRLLGIMTLSAGLIGGSGPWVWGKMFEVAQNYNLACLVSAICMGIATIALMLIRPAQAQLKSSLKPKEVINPT
jgi:MFS family permease